MKKVKTSATAMRKAFSNLRRNGDVSKLTSFFNGKYSQPHISNVLAGRRNNEEILKKAYSLVSRRTVNA